MDIRVSGHQVDTGEALQTHVEKRLGSIAEKYFAKALSSHATFGRAPHDGFASDIVMHVMQGLVLKGRGEAQDAHIAFDRAAERIEKQLRRYMRRLQDRHVQTAYAMAQEEAAYTVFDAGDIVRDLLAGLEVAFGGFARRIADHASCSTSQNNRSMTK